MFGIQNALNQVSTWSRAMQWAFWAGTLTIAFLIWDATIAEMGVDWSTQVATKERQIKEIQLPTTFTSKVKNAISSFGEVELPRSKSEGAAALTEAVHNILSNHDVENDEYTRTKTSRMKSGSLPGIVSANEHIEQVIGDIRFEASQEEVLNVISELESSPWIDVVSDVRFTRQGGRFIRVDLSVEAWVVSTANRRGK
ncbi:MAG: hypothetical protein ISR75_01705 [Phycisphaerales bacterium]|nr:hypothetical protein [Planctomycetota bacterium]MBL6997140.1 hypothetical protein [Phycisphaerales bacterium]